VLPLRPVKFAVKVPLVLLPVFVEGLLKEEFVLYWNPVALIVPPPVPVTEPLRVAVVGPTLLELPVVTEAKPMVVKFWIVPDAVPASFVARAR